METKSRTFKTYTILQIAPVSGYVYVWRYDQMGTDPVEIVVGSIVAFGVARVDLHESLGEGESKIYDSSTCPVSLALWSGNLEILDERPEFLGILRDGDDVIEFVRMSFPEDKFRLVDR